MKILIPLMVFSVTFFSCKKEAEPNCTDGIQNQDEVYVDCGGACNACPIDYPDNGPWGTNILKGSDSLFLSPGDYSFKATVPPGSSLSVKATIVSGDIWLYGTNNGWSVGVPSTSQTFDVAGSGTAELLFNLSTGSGVTLLEIFENESTQARERVLVWG
jgi:hypothetical protein